MPDETVVTQDPVAPPAPEAKPADSGEPKPPEHMIPKSRFDEVSKRAQAYERFGSPEQLGQAMNALAYYQEIERQATEEAEKSPKGEVSDETAKKFAEAKEILYAKVDPELAKSKEQAKIAHAYTEVQQDRCRRIATRETKAILKEASLDDSDAAVMRTGKQLASYFEDSDYNDEFWVNPRQAVRRAWTAWTDDIKKTLPPKEPEPNKDTHARLPRAPSPTGGSPPSGRSAPDSSAMSDKEFEKHIAAKLRGSGQR